MGIPGVVDKAEGSYIDGGNIVDGDGDSMSLKDFEALVQGASHTASLGTNNFNVQEAAKRSQELALLSYSAHANTGGGPRPEPTAPVHNRTIDTKEGATLDGRDLVDGDGDRIVMSDAALMATGYRRMGDVQSAVQLEGIIGQAYVNFEAYKNGGTQFPGQNQDPNDTGGNPATGAAPGGAAPAGTPPTTSPAPTTQPTAAKPPATDPTCHCPASPTTPPLPGQPTSAPGKPDPTGAPNRGVESKRGKFDADPDQDGVLEIHLDKDGTIRDADGDAWVIRDSVYGTSRNGTLADWYALANKMYNDGDPSNDGAAVAIASAGALAEGQARAEGSPAGDNFPTDGVGSDGNVGGAGTPLKGPPGITGAVSDDEEGGNWIRAMAKALGRQADVLARELDSMAQNIGNGTGEGGNSDGVMPSNLALFNAAAGEFQLFMSCITKALDAANKGSQSLAQ